MLNLNGWDVASSVRIEHLNDMLTREVKGKPFDSVEDDCHVKGTFASWQLSVPKRGGAVHLTVVVDKAVLSVSGLSNDCDGLRVGFDIDFVHMAATPADPRELVQLDFKSAGMGAGDTATFDVSFATGNPPPSSDAGSATAMLEQIVATLIINAILANPTMAAMPIATLMQQGSIQAKWYKPKHVDFAVSTLENGLTYVSMLVSQQDVKPADLPGQPPAELHGGFVNMAFSRAMFFANVVVPSLQHRLQGTGTQATTARQDKCEFVATGDTLASWIYPDFLMALRLSTVPVLNVSRILLTLKHVTASWVDANVETSITGECALEVAGVNFDSLGWYTFSGPATHALVFDSASQKLRAHQVMSAAADVDSKGMAAVSSFFAPSSKPSFDTGALALNLCAVPEFPPVSEYSFIWAGLSQPQFQSANFDNDVVFHSAPSSATQA